MERLIVFLDDEISFEKGFRHVEEEIISSFQDKAIVLKLFNDPVECLDYLMKCSEYVVMLVCDWCMPEIDGVSFLENLNRKYGHIHPLLMSGGSVHKDIMQKNRFIKAWVKKDDIANQVVKYLKQNKELLH